jgi:hypothetical protein
MDWQLVEAIGETVGAIAVVVTLVYLARQVGQARREQQIAAIRTNRNERRQFFEAVRDSPDLIATLSKASSGESLTAEENLRLLAHNSALWALVYAEWVQSQLGLAGEYSTPIETVIATHITQPGVADWFRAMGPQLYPPGFVADVRRVEQGLAATSHTTA